MMEPFQLYTSIMGYGLGIAVAYIALLFMGSRLLQRPDLEGRAKHEAVQILVTLFLLPALFIAVDNVFGTLAQQVDPAGYAISCPTGGSGCHFAVVKNFIGEILREEVWLLSQSFVAVNTLQILNSFSTNFHSLQAGKGSMEAKSHPYAGLTEPQVIDLKKVDEWAFRSFQVTAFLLALLQYMESAFPVLLGVGLALRLFPIGRKIGGLLLAIALALYYIFPLPLLVGANIYHTIPPVQVGEDANGNPIFMRIAKINLDVSLSSNVGKGIEKGILRAYESFSVVDTRKMAEVRREWEEAVEEYGEEKTFWESLVDNIIGAIGGTVNYFVERVEALLDFVKDLYAFITSSASFVTLTFFQLFTEKYFYRYYFEVASSFITLSIISFYVATIASIAFVKQFSPMLGGDVEIGGLTHLV